MTTEKHISPQEAIDMIKASSGGATVFVTEIEKLLRWGTARELQEFFTYVQKIHYSNKHLYEQTALALQLRISEDGVEAAKEITTHVKSLNEQTKQLHDLTQSHVEHSKTLTLQTDTMIKESKKLGNLTWCLLILTVVLAVLTGALLYIDWGKERKPERIVNVDPIKPLPNK